ncbi:unnamed protein product [Protopolystoma xenopodis]|uniref:Uncharacterized protein n=1 Tax=Protopolystoma xenopodis TaxID=117903 RepID=A0A448WWD1_9PLAT|nr:unnamed protein product [Protopolystoma xenopodis]
MCTCDWDRCEPRLFFPNPGHGASKPSYSHNQTSRRKRRRPNGPGRGCCLACRQPVLYGQWYVQLGQTELCLHHRPSCLACRVCGRPIRPGDRCSAIPLPRASDDGIGEARVGGDELGDLEQTTRGLVCAIHVQNWLADAGSLGSRKADIGAANREDETGGEVENRLYPSGDKSFILKVSVDKGALSKRREEEADGGSWSDDKSCRRKRRSEYKFETEREEEDEAKVAAEESGEEKECMKGRHKNARGIANWSEKSVKIGRQSSGTRQSKMKSDMGLGLGPGVEEPMETWQLNATGFVCCRYRLRRMEERDAENAENVEMEAEEEEEEEEEAEEEEEEEVAEGHEETNGTKEQEGEENGLEASVVRTCKMEESVTRNEHFDESPVKMVELVGDRILDLAKRPDQVRKTH